MYKETKINIKNDKLVGNKIVVISDIHYNDKKDLKKLERLYNVLKNYNPNYICIPGDIIDNNDIDKTYILEWLEKLSKIGKVIVSLGNHDLREKIKPGKYKNFIDEDYISDLEKIDNLYLLNNKNVEFEDIYFYGYTQSFYYYYSNKNEDRFIMKKEIINNKVCNKLPDKFKVLLMHSPICLKYDEIDKMLSKYDLILTGHMHNGVMPPILDDVFKNDVGLIAPNKRLFPKYARGVVKKDNIVVISSGVTKLSKSAPKVLWPLNIFFPIGINVIEFTNNKEYIKSRYFTK